MAQPTPSGVHIDRALTNISVAYVQSRNNFIANRVFPAVPVSKQTDKYFTFDQNDWFRDEAQVRPPATESAGGGFNVSTDSYSCDVFAFHKDLDDQLLANADAPLDLESAAAEFVAQRMLLRHEIEWTASFFTTGIWGTDNTTAVDWDNYATSTPLLDVETARGVILAATGFEPNTMVVGYDVFAALKNHPTIVDRISPTSPEVITEQIMARLFEMDNFYVARAVRATNNEGAAGAYAFVQGDNALVAFVPPSPSLMTPSAGYTFEWTGVTDGGGETIGTSRIPMPELRAVRIESQMAWDSKRVAANLGYFFSDLTT